MMKEMGIDVSPEEVAILAADSRMVKRIEREEREERAKYWSWRSVPISGRQDVGREVREEKEKGDEKEVEKESSSSLPRETPPRQGKDSSSVVVVGKATDQVIEVETESSEKSLDDLEKEMRDADAEIFKAARFLAGRFAAKEATMKAHLSRRLTYHSILILRPERKKGETGSLAPVGIVLPESENGGEEGGKEVRISISHDGDFATAVCLAVDE